MVDWEGVSCCPFKGGGIAPYHFSGCEDLERLGGSKESLSLGLASETGGGGLLEEQTQSEQEGTNHTNIHQSD